MGWGGKKVSAPNLPQSYQLKKIRGVAYESTFRGKRVLIGWPRKRGKPKSPVTIEQNQQFKVLVAAQKDIWAGDAVNARLLAKDSGYTWRDVVSRAMTGQLITWSQYVAANIQEELDTITSQIGDILLRTADGWVGLPAGSHGQALLIDLLTGLPAWGDAAAGGGGLFSEALSDLPTQTMTGFNTWVNQGAASVQDISTGFQLIGDHTSSQMRGLSQLVPATPYKVTALLAHSANANTCQTELGWYDGTKLHTFALVNSGAWNLGVQKWNSVSSAGTNDFTLNGCGAPLMWVQLEDDGTNVHFRFGWCGDDGSDASLQQAFTVAKASGWLGASGYTHLFFGNVSNVASSDPRSTILSWVIT